MLTGVLQRSGEDGSEWQQDCLASLLKMLCQLGVNPQNELKSVRSDKVYIPNLNEVCNFNFDLLMFWCTSDFVINLCDVDLYYIAGVVMNSLSIVDVLCIYFTLRCR